MRTFMLIAALALGACERAVPTAEAGCARTATQAVTWSNAGSPDLITTHADGPSCAQAVVTLAVRNASGDPLWVFASTYYEMTMGGVPPEGAAPVSAEQMDQFLASWADVTLQGTGELPQWREGFETLSASAQTFSYATRFDRETYETLRARNLPMMCYAAALESSQCLIIDPASQTPVMMAAYGP